MSRIHEEYKIANVSHYNLSNSYPCRIHAVELPDCDGPREDIVHPTGHDDGFVVEGVRHHEEQDEGHDVRPRRGRKDFVDHLKYGNVIF